MDIASLTPISAQLIRPYFSMVSQLLTAGSAQVSRFELARSHQLALLRSRCHGITDRFQVLELAAGDRARTRP